MRGLFLFIYFSFFISFFKPSFSCSEFLKNEGFQEDRAYDSVNKFGMKIWTKVDLIKATNSTPAQNHFFVDELLNDILSLYSIIYYATKLDLLNKDNRDDIMNLVEFLDKSFKLDFCKESHNELITINTILSKVKNVLLIK